MQSHISFSLTHSKVVCGEESTSMFVSFMSSIARCKYLHFDICNKFSGNQHMVMMILGLVSNSTLCVVSDFSKP